jgi:hypothetical protein
MIGVGGAGGNIVNAFFKSLDHKAIRIEPWIKFNNPYPAYLTDVILSNGVPGKFGWWIYNTARGDLQNLAIVREKLEALYPLNDPIPKEASIQSNDKSEKDLINAREKTSEKQSFEDHIREHFTAGMSQQEGAGKSFILGKGGMYPLTDIEYNFNKTGRKEPKLKFILDNLEKRSWRSSNGLLMIHGSARGTGSGATCRIIQCLKQLRSDLHILDLMVLPSIPSGDSRYEDAINQTTFSILSLLRDENEKRLVGGIMLAHNDRLHELCLAKKKPFLYADRSINIGQRRVWAGLKTGGGRDSSNGLLVDLLGLLSSTHILGREEEAFDLSNIVKALEPPTSDLDLPGIMVPCVYISANGNATTEELVTHALTEGSFVKCDPSTSRAMYIILFVNTKVKGNALIDIYHVTNDTVDKLYPNAKFPKLKTPDYVDTRGKFAAAVVLLINPRIPIIEQYFDVTRQYLEKIQRTSPAKPQAEAVLMLEDWQDGLSDRADSLLKMLGSKWVKEESQK